MIDELLRQRNEQRNMAIGAALAMGILVGFFDTCGLVYAKLFATEADATVTSVVRSETAEKRPTLSAVFEFSDPDGQKTTRREKLKPSTLISKGDQVRIRYYPGKDDSFQLIEPGLPITVYLFCGAAVLGLGWVVVLAREANS